MPGTRRLVALAAAATTYAVSTALGPPARAVPFVTGDEGTPCWAEQIAVTASPTHVRWGGPTIHAEPTLREYMGGLPPSVDVPPSVIMSISTQAQAIVEGMAVDGSGNPCPSYTDLRVSPPNISMVFTVPGTIDACQLQVHPVTEA